MTINQLSPNSTSISAPSFADLLIMAKYQVPLVCYTNMPV